MDYAWRAFYGDEVVYQFPPEGGENTSAVWATRGMPDRLMVGSSYGVNLKTNSILYKNTWQVVGDKDGLPFGPAELIYFRRNKVTANGEEGTRRRVWHFVGLKWDRGQIMICIPDDGTDGTLCLGV